MNSPIARALLEDAFYQVLDNKVFRLLALLVFALIAPTFLIGFRENEIDLLFGWQRIDYAHFFESFGTSLPHVKHLNVEVIQGLQGLFVRSLAGTIGILFCIAATAFFVPRMLEKGAADILFSKPVSRLALLLARYVAGILFVAVLAIVLVVGMHIGLLVTSGYSDPAFLWSALTLIYVFALVHAFSTCVAAFTRSSVAAMLCTLMFFVSNGCVHQIWVTKEHRNEKKRLVNEAALEKSAEEPDSNARKIADEHAAAKVAEPKESLIVTWMIATLDVLHYTLPKTNDADILTAKLRTMVAGKELALHDAGANLDVKRPPKDFEPVFDTPAVDLSRTPAVWTAHDEGGTEVGRMSLSRRSRLYEKQISSNDKKDVHIRKQTANAAASEFEKSLTDRAQMTGRPVRTRESIGEFSTEFVAWIEDDGPGAFAHEKTFFTLGDSMIELEAIYRSNWIPDDEREVRTRDFIEGFRLADENARNMSPIAWYEHELGCTSRLKYNALFSIASSLAFGGLMLALAWRRLERIDF